MRTNFEIVIPGRLSEAVRTRNGNGYDSNFEIVLLVHGWRGPRPRHRRRHGESITFNPGRSDRFIEELQYSPRHRVLGLAGDGHIPILGLRQAFFDVSSRRGRVRGVAAWNDKRRNVEAQQILGFGARRSVAVEQRAGHAGDGKPVAIRVLLRK
jgi:hypothetical protein